MGFLIVDEWPWSEVKIRHPGVAETMAVDFTLMRALAQLVDRLPGLGWVNLRDAIAQFEARLAQRRISVSSNSQQCLFLDCDWVVSAKPTRSQKCSSQNVIAISQERQNEYI